MMDGNKKLMTEFEEVTSFLAEYRWLFDFKLTRIFIENVLDNIPDEWKETLTRLSVEELSGLPYGQTKPDWPCSLKVFIQTCLKFSLQREVTGLYSNERVASPRPKASTQSREVTGQKLKTVNQYDVAEFKTSNNSSCAGNNNDTDLNKSKEITQFNCKDFENALSPLDISEQRESTQQSIFKHGFCPLDLPEIDANVRKGMSEKKFHEVCHMTSMIDHVTGVANNNGVVDVGSGLGYLGQVLHGNYGNSVLGLEGKQGHTTGADKRLDKFECSGHLHNLTCELYEESSSKREFVSLVEDWFSKLKKSKCSHQCPEYSRTKPLQTGSQRKQTGCLVSQAGSSVFQTGTVTGQTGYSKSMTGSNLIIENQMTNSTKTGSEIKKTASQNTQTGFQSMQTGSVNNLTGSIKSQTDPEKFSEKCGSRLSANIGTRSDLDLQSPQLCMVGLHCCGDLTPTMLKYFVDLDMITSLVCVSCCYHRMEYCENSQRHVNFPMSRLLRDAVQKTKDRFPSFRFSPFCLRLAAQETRARWNKQSGADHDFHKRNVGYRGILETCLDQEKDRFSLKKSARKLAHGKDFDSFSTYTEAVVKHIQIPEGSGDEFKQDFFSEMQTKYDLYEKYFDLIEPMTALQYLLQPVIETLIYMDRKQWLAQHGYRAEIIPIFDELISPRNLALIAIKNLT